MPESSAANPSLATTESTAEAVFHSHPAGPAIACMLGAVFFYAVMDTLSRVVGPIYGVVLVVVARFGVHTAWMGSVLALRRLRGKTVVHQSSALSQGLRALLLFASGSMAVLALQHMPVAEYTAVIMLTPVLVTLMAGLVLRERIRPIQWAMVAGGLAGALIVIRPGSGLFGTGALFAVGVVLLNTTYQLVTRLLARDEDAVTTNFHLGWVGFLLSLGLLASSSNVVPAGVAMSTLMAPQNLALLVAVGLLASAAQLLVIKALARTEASVLMPFVYAQIAFATLSGWLLLGDRPDGLGWLGMAIIAVCGVTSGWAVRRRQ